jgi:hypothetical protein
MFRSETVCAVRLAHTKERRERTPCARSAETETIQLSVERPAAQAQELGGRLLVANRACPTIQQNSSCFAI